MPSVSQSQQRAAAIALHAPESELRGASKQMAQSMSKTELHKFAATPRKGLPHEKALLGMNAQGTTNTVGYPIPKACMTMKEAVRFILNHVLAETEGDDSPEESQEVALGQTILAALERLQISLPSPAENQQRDLTTIRASANTLIRMHQAGQPALGKDFFRLLDPTR